MVSSTEGTLLSRRWASDSESPWIQYFTCSQERAGQWGAASTRAAHPSVDLLCLHCPLSIDETLRRWWRARSIPVREDAHSRKEGKCLNTPGWVLPLPRHRWGSRHPLLLGTLVPSTPSPLPQAAHLPSGHQASPIHLLNCPLPYPVPCRFARRGKPVEVDLPGPSSLGIGVLWGTQVTTGG